MGWTVSNFSGTYMGGDPSNTRVAMFELCRAVNQRQAAVRTTKTTFYNTAGSLGSDRVLSDFEDIRVTGVNNNSKQNITRVAGAIITLLNAGYFTTTSGGTTVYTVSSVEAIIGVSLSATFVKAQQASYWQALKDALDLMIYIKVTASSNDDGTGTATSSGPGGGYPSFQDAWDAKYDNAVGHLSTLSAYWALGATPGWNCTIQTHTNNISFNTSVYNGVLQASYYQYRKVYGEGATSGFTITVGTNEIVVDSNSSPFNPDTILTTDVTIDSNTTVSVAITSTIPAIVPFSSPGTVSFDLEGLVLYIDIASLLSDQT